MALDEALLEAMPRLGQPVLRFYSWTEPATTFGYFQKHRDVERATLLRPLIRRPTGGGIVPHDADWTYSLVFPASHEWHSLKATESYRRVHEWIQAAFARVNVPTELAPASSAKQGARNAESRPGCLAPVSGLHPPRSALPNRPVFHRPRKIRRALARPKNCGRGATAKYIRVADSRFGAAAADGLGPGRLAKCDA